MPADPDFRDQAVRAGAIALARLTDFQTRYDDARDVAEVVITAAMPALEEYATRRALAALTRATDDLAEVVHDMSGMPLPPPPR